jgi:hypothetical protein
MTSVVRKYRLLTAKEGWDMLFWLGIYLGVDGEARMARRASAALGYQLQFLSDSWIAPY